MYALYNKFSVLEATLNHYKEKSAQYEEHYGRLTTRLQNRGEVVIEWGAGRVVPPPVASQLRMGSGGVED
jgi:hypothetical protein